MLDLHLEYELFAQEVREAVGAVLDSQQFIGGPAIAELEQAISSKLGIEHAVAVSNGSDSLLCVMMALGIGPGDEVIVPTLTFFASAGSVHRLGAKPVFVDVDERTFTMDVERLQQAITPRTRAIMPVHLFGQCADMDGINAIAKEHGLAVIEDAAQAIGSIYRGRPAGGMGKAGCLSFYPTKNLGGFGEGGMILTHDEALATLCRQLRNHGQSSRYIHEHVGGNFRLDTIKAAILLVKLRYWERFTQKRIENARLYDEMLRSEAVATPYVPDYNRPVYHQYSILCDRRDELADYLRQRGIETSVYYPVPLHAQPCFAHLNPLKNQYPVADAICKRILSLPVHPMMTEQNIRQVAAAIHGFYDSTN